MSDNNEIGPNPAGTILLLAACIIGYFLSTMEETSSKMAGQVSMVLLGAIAISFLFDMKAGIRNLIRVDIFALIAFYFLTFFEFLFPQSKFDLLVIPENVITATQLTLLGFATIVVGRHINLFPRRWLEPIGAVRIRDGDFLVIYLGATFLNFLPMFLAVDFNPVTWFNELLEPRFTQPWSRGRYGSLATLLNELKLLGYVMPPLAGVIFARRKHYKLVSLVVVALTMLMLYFVAFAGGTRNVLAIQLAGLLGGYFVIQPKIRLVPMVITVLAIGASFLYLAERMLEFREMGLRRYVEGGYYQSGYREIADTYLAGAYEQQEDSGYMVDYNLWRISQMVAAFPEQYDYIGFNMPYVAITKPIPRAFWPGKPKDLKVGLEEVVGAEGYTVACTWMGEAFIAGGVLWIVGVGLLIGAFCCFWNGLATYIHSAFPLIVFASGFYAVLLLMRSLMFFTTALLPSIALIIMGLIVYKTRGVE